MNPHESVPQLIATAPDGSRQVIELTGKKVTLGRALDNDLAFPQDSGLSRHHLELEQVAGRWVIRDLGSKNGTLFNGERLTVARPLAPGDRIETSRVTLLFAEAGRTSEPATVIFDASASLEQLSAHTVSLPELLARDQMRQTQPGLPGREWSDPVRVLVRAGRQLMARKSLPELYEDTLCLCMEAVGARRGVLLLKEAGGLRAGASRGEEFRISSAVRDRVLEGRASLLVRDALLDDAWRVRQSIVLEKVRSLVAVPLQTDDQVLGLIYVDSPHLWREFSPRDLDLLTVIANVAALRIERERLAALEEQQRVLELELARAAEIQRQILPERFPAAGDLELAGYNAPCQTVGGDYYDFLTRPDGSVLVVLADVAGKGMSAALLMINLQARVEMLAAAQAGGPAAMVAQLNRAMRAVCPGNRFITLFLCQIDPATGECAYTNAGHNPALLVSADGGLKRLEGGGPVLGIFPEAPYEEYRLPLQPGDRLVLFSDGVTEATQAAGLEFGEERLIEAVRAGRGTSAEDLIASLRRAVEEFTAGHPAPDDLTLVAARWRGASQASAPGA